MISSHQLAWYSVECDPELFGQGVLTRDAPRRPNTLKEWDTEKWLGMLLDSDGADD